MRLYIPFIFIFILLLFSSVYADLSSPDTTEPTTGPRSNMSMNTTITPIISPVPSPVITQAAEPTLVPVPGPFITQSAEPTATQTGNPTPEPTSVPEPSPVITQDVEPTLVPAPGPFITPAAEPTAIRKSSEPASAPIRILAVSGNFSISSDPTGANIFFDGSFSGLTPKILEVPDTSLPPHTLILQKNGYQNWTTSIDHSPAPGMTEPISGTLLPNAPNGSISITSTPSGATASLDGASILTTPCTYQEVLPGVHTVGVSKDGYSPYSTQITVASGAQSVVSASLTPVTSTGSLTVGSVPSGAYILLNNVVYGITPSHFNAISAGTYTLTLSRFGYQPVSQQIEVVAGKENSISLPLPRRIPVTGTLNIRSYPSYGVVEVNNEEKGVTPLRIRGLRPTSYAVRVSVPGYLDWIGIVDVTPGWDTSVYATLSPKGTHVYSGSVSVSSVPSGSSVSIDGRLQGRTPILIQNVASGTHSIVVAHDGYSPVATDVQVDTGRTRDISVTLPPYPGKNLTPDLIRVSDDAAVYFTAHGRSGSLSAFNSPDSGFTRDNRYVIAMDPNGTVLADGGNRDLIGINLSESNGSDTVLTGALMTATARLGGGLIYDTTLSANESGEVSLVYTRPAINGVVIGTVTPVDIVFPGVTDDPAKMRKAVHSAVESAKNMTRYDLEERLAGISSDINIRSFDLNAPDNTDLNGVSPTRLLTMAAGTGGGYVWIPDTTDSSGETRLILGYAEKVDDTWGIWASADEKDPIIMMDTDVTDV